MNTGIPNANDSLAGHLSDFSLVLGGPLYQLWRRAHLSGDTLELLRRRIVVSTMLAWLPLLVLSMAEGHAWGGSVALPFFHDIEMHVRLLVAMPILILAELVVHQRIRPIAEQFLTRKLVPDAARGQFDAAITAAMRLRNSMTAEVLLVVLVYVVGVGFIWRTQIAMDTSSWHGAPLNGQSHPTLAGWWMGLVSLPIFQFLLARWYFRLFIWARFLWQVSRIHLSFMPMHPDRCGGLGFLSGISKVFAPVLFAQGAVLAGVIADRIFFGGDSLATFKLEIIGLAAVMILTILGPLLVFLPKLAAAKRTGTREFGVLAQTYAREFDHKWLRGGAPADEPLIGSADIQSLADLGNSYAVVKEMRVLPFSVQTVLQLAVITLLPVAPLLLTMIPLEQLLERLFKIIF